MGEMRKESIFSFLSKRRVRVPRAASVSCWLPVLPLGLMFQSLREVGGRTQWRKECSRSRQIDFGLRHSGLCGECIDVSRYDIKNPIKFLLRFWKTTKKTI